MIELYIYKYLEIIGVGAKVDFLPNYVSSKRVVYICGEAVPNFTVLGDDNVNENKMWYIYDLVFVSLILIGSLGATSNAAIFGATKSSPRASFNCPYYAKRWRSAT